MKRYKAKQRKKEAWYETMLLRYENIDITLLSFWLIIIVQTYSIHK